MEPFDELQEADIRLTFRKMYADLGFLESLKVLNETMVTARIMTEVILEERAREETDPQS